MTPWFDAATTCPDKPGVYLAGIANRFAIGYSAWRGGKWHSIQATPSAADLSKYETTFVAHCKDAQWRGFTEKQEA